MKYKLSFLLLLLLVTSTTIFAQQDGYWDKDRATTKQIVVSARDRLIVKTEDFPLGTTEVIYRITLLDENQQMANSLVSLLKAIPDPYGIGQGSAGAVFLLSKVSGDDKCKYAVFSSEAAAATYTKAGDTDKSCWYQNTPVSKDAKRLTLDKSSCLSSDAMWFGFESKNWIMNQKIVLEVVPWVDSKLNRGWTVENRKSIVSLCKTSDLAKLMVNSDDLCLCILDKIQQQYRFREYDKLMAIEKTKVFKDMGNACLSRSEANKTLLNTIRVDAAKHFANKRYGNAIQLLLTGIIENGNATALDYNSLGTAYLYSKQYNKAIKALKEGEKLDSAELLIQLNLAHAYMLNNDFSAAKEIHKKYKSQNVTAMMSWTSKTKADFTAFKSAGIESENFDRILRVLE